MPFNTKSHRESLNMPVCACQLAVLSLHRFANLEIIAIDCSDPDAVLWEEVRLAHTRTTGSQHDSMCSGNATSLCTIVMFIILGQLHDLLVARWR